MKQRAMRNGQNKRMRGRNRSKGQNPLTRVYESNGPDVKIRGTASHVAEKYVQLARDAQSSGDPVGAENYYQHAEHYFRLIAAAQEQFRQNNPYVREGEVRDSYDDADEDATDQPIMTGEPYAPREHAQPYQQPRENRFPPREGGQPYPPRSQPAQSAPESDDGDVDRLPAFVTGGSGAPQAAPQPSGPYGGNGHDGGTADRFPLHRRRRRRHGGPREHQPGTEPGESQGGPRGPTE
jgi:hypothetical protein